MLESGIIEPMEEFEWVIPMVVQEKKQGGIRIYVDLKKLNDAFLHDPFPTPFTYKVLENAEVRKDSVICPRLRRQSQRQHQNHFESWIYPSKTQRGISLFDIDLFE
jgi:hypothetical protein